MDELIQEFLAETNDSLGELDMQLVELEKNPEDKEIIDNIFRLMHTIKGTCGFLGLTRLATLAHASENVLDNIRDGKLSPDASTVTIILESIDQIKELMEHLEEHESEPEGDDSDLIARLNEAAGGGGPRAAAASDSGDSGGESFDEIAAKYEDGEEWSEEDLQKLFDATDSEGDGEETPPEEEAAPPAPAAEPSEEEVQKEAVEQGLKAADTLEKKPPAEKKSTAAQSLRVNIDVLEELMQMVSELVLTRNQLTQMVRNDLDSPFYGPLQQLNHITSDLQEGVMKTRMQPISNAWAKFPRIIRDLSIELEKKIDLEMVGQETELDRQLLDMIKDPLTHMVRNSVDHGIEPPAERLEAGKPETGTVTLSASHEGGHIVITIADDGRGVNIERVKQKALDNGIVTEAELERMTDQQICQFIFAAGFSTAEQVTSVSGRGVGMDVVRTNIEKIGGNVELTSTPGKGSTFHIKIPLTLAIMPVFVVEADKQRYAIPQIHVDEIISIYLDEDSEQSEYQIEEIHGSQVLRLREKLYPLIDLRNVLALGEPEEPKEETCITVCHVGSQRFGMIVDKVFDTEEIVVKPVSTLLQTIDVYSGCTILGDGSVIMILDMNNIIKRLGELQPAKAEEEETARLLGDDSGKTAFLLFRAGGKSPRAVPLELVSRLEELEVSAIEWSNDKQVVQYRDQLMRITTLDESYNIPEEGIMNVVVFSDEGKVMGIVVEEILDIVEHEMDIASMTSSPGFVGSMVIEGHTTDLVDISHYFSQHFSDWLTKKDLPDSAGGPARPDHKTHLLLVDDSPFFRKFMKPILTVADYQVTTSDSAIKALEMLEAGLECDAIITDIDMPEMDGIEFANKLRQDPRYNHLPIVGLSSYSGEEIMEKTSEVGFDAFVSKADRDQLVSTIEEMFQRISHDSPKLAAQ